MMTVLFLNRFVSDQENLTENGSAIVASKWLVLNLCQVVRHQLKNNVVYVLYRLEIVNFFLSFLL